jgi:hypothetical protein
MMNQRGMQHSDQLNQATGGKQECRLAHSGHLHDVLDTRPAGIYRHSIGFDTGSKEIQQ